jgi:hypothetical protein
VDFVPVLALATRHEHQSDPQYGDFIQYDLMLVEETETYAGSLLFHWNYGVPIEDELFDVPAPRSAFEDQLPTIDRLFLPDGEGSVALDHGELIYTDVGTADGELLGVVFDLSFADGTRFKGKVAAPLEVKVHVPDPPAGS